MKGNETSSTKNILVINGTTRGNGNTDTIIDKMIAGFIDADANMKIKLIELRKKKIADCIGCYKCYKEDTCSLMDDMSDVHEEIKKSDLIVLASPLYWWGVTGLMKTFIDRLYFYYSAYNANIIAGKKVLVVTTMAVSEIEPEADPLKEFYRLIFKRLKVNLVDMVFFSGLKGNNDALEKTGLLDHVYSMGKKMYSSYFSTTMAASSTITL
jgi:multimeric flavodoxin WrbA